MRATLAHLACRGAKPRHRTPPVEDSRSSSPNVGQGTLAWRVAVAAAARGDSRAAFEAYGAAALAWEAEGEPIAAGLALVEAATEALGLSPNEDLLEELAHRLAQLTQRKDLPVGGLVRLVVSSLFVSRAARKPAPLLGWVAALRRSRSCDFLALSAPADSPSVTQRKPAMVDSTPASSRLKAERIQHFLAEHSDWSFEDSTLVRRYEMGTADAVLAFACLLAELAEQLGSSPRFEIQKACLTLRLDTAADRGPGLANLDLAERLQGLG